MPKSTTTLKKRPKMPAKGESRVADPTVLRNPRMTEKAANNSQYSIYVFDVATTVKKSEIIKAFHMLYKARPIKVNMVTMRAKSYFRRGRLGFGTKGKKAYVFLPKGSNIQII